MGMKQKFWAAFVATLSLVLVDASIPSTALAVTYRFDVTDPDSTLGGQQFSPYYFFLDRTPTLVSSDDNSFTLDGTTFGSTLYGPYEAIDTFIFFTSDSSGGLQNYENVYFGPQLFTGPTTAPTFVLGTFELDNYG